MERQQFHFLKLIYKVSGLTPTIHIKVFAFRLNILLQLDELSPLPPPPKKAEIYKSIRECD
jgi:hypothetical protein